MGETDILARTRAALVTLRDSEDWDSAQEVEDHITGTIAMIDEYTAKAGQKEPTPAPKLAATIAVDANGFGEVKIVHAAGLKPGIHKLFHLGEQK